MNRSQPLVGSHWGLRGFTSPDLFPTRVDSHHPSSCWQKIQLLLPRRLLMNTLMLQLKRIWEDFLCVYHIQSLQLKWRSLLWTWGHLLEIKKKKKVDLKNSECVLHRLQWMTTPPLQKSLRLPVQPLFFLLENFLKSLKHLVKDW